MSNFAAEYDAAVASIAAVFAERQDYAVIGGLALAFHGVPRATQDIDLLLSLRRMELPPILETLASYGFSFDIHGVLCELRDQQRRTMNMYPFLFSRNRCLPPLDSWDS